MERRIARLSALRRSCLLTGKLTISMHDETYRDPNDPELVGFSPEDLLKLARWKMPFGKYQGHVLIDLPEEYLFWFTKKGFPEGELGLLMKFCLDLKIEGLDSVVRPLKSNYVD